MDSVIIHIYRGGAAFRAQSGENNHRIVDLAGAGFVFFHGGEFFSVRSGISGLLLVNRKGNDTMTPCFCHEVVKWREVGVKGAFLFILSLAVFVGISPKY